jgi:hypothetical protein
MQWTSGSAKRQRYLNVGETTNSILPRAEGESFIKCSSPLNVLNDTYEHSCY